MSEKISNDDIMYVLRSLVAFFEKVQGEDCPEEMLLVAQKIPFSEIKLIIAKSPSATERVLMKLIQNEKEKQVRDAAVRNPNATEKIFLEALDTFDHHDDPNYEIPLFVASSEKATENVLIKALSIKNSDVREAAIRNPVVSENVLLKAIKIEGIATSALSSKKSTERVFLETVENFKLCKSLLANSYELKNDRRLTPAVLEKALDLHGSKQFTMIKHEKLLLGDYMDKTVWRTIGYAVYYHPNATEELKKKAKKYL